MPVYNGEHYLGEALDSILSQTYQDFRLLAIDDGSTDNSLEILRSIHDPRISIETNQTNMGLIETLNKGLGLIESEYIARMDCDDIATPHRLEEQVRFMDTHPDIGLCGGYYERFTDTESIVARPPLKHEDILYALIFDNVIAHNTIMFRQSIIAQHNLRYDPRFSFAEDYELWVRFSQYGRIANIPSVLVKYRFHSGNTSSRFKREQEITAVKVRRIQQTNLGLSPREEDAELHRQLFSMRFDGTPKRLTEAGAWLSKLYGVAVSRCRQRPISTFLQFNRLWYSACGKIADSGPEVFFLFIKKPYGLFGNPMYTVKLFFRCLTRTKIA